MPFFSKQMLGLVGTVQWIHLAKINGNDIWDNNVAIEKLSCCWEGTKEYSFVSWPGSWRREHASQMLFCLPGKYLALVTQLYRADIQNRMRYMNCTRGILEVPLLIHDTAEELSLCMITLLFTKYLLHLHTDKKIAINSFNINMGHGTSW